MRFEDMIRLTQSARQSGIDLVELVLDEARTSGTEDWDCFSWSLRSIDVADWFFADVASALNAECAPRGEAQPGRDWELVMRMFCLLVDCSWVSECPVRREGLREAYNKVVGSSGSIPVGYEVIVASLVDFAKNNGRYPTERVRLLIALMQEELKLVTARYDLDLCKHALKLLFAGDKAVVAFETELLKLHLKSHFVDDVMLDAATVMQILEFGGNRVVNALLAAYQAHVRLTVTRDLSSEEVEGAMQNVLLPIEQFVSVNSPEQSELLSTFVILTRKLDSKHWPMMTMKHMVGICGVARFRNLTDRSLGYFIAIFNFLGDHVLINPVLFSALTAFREILLRSGLEASVRKYLLEYGVPAESLRIVDAALLYTLNQVVPIPDNVHVILRSSIRQDCTTYKIICAILGEDDSDGHLLECYFATFHNYRPSACYCKRHATGIHLLELLNLKGKPESEEWPALFNKLVTRPEDMEFFAPTIWEVLDVTLAGYPDKFVSERLELMTWGLPRDFEAGEMRLIAQLSEASHAAVRRD